VKKRTRTLENPGIADSRSVVAEALVWGLVQCEAPNRLLIHRRDFPPMKAGLAVHTSVSLAYLKVVLLGSAMVKQPIVLAFVLESGLQM